MWYATPPMTEMAGEIPFLWRIGAESSDGYCSVAMVVPCPPEADVSDLTIETSVLSMSSDNGGDGEEILEWNQQDISLFLRLVAQHKRQGEHPPSDIVRVNLTDPAIIDIIQVVAAASFGMAFQPTEVLRSVSGCLPAQNCDIGSFASLSTIRGFKSCVVVGMDGEEAICVLLDEIPGESREELPDFNRLDLLLVNRADLLHPEFAENTTRPKTATLH